MTTGKDAARMPVIVTAICLVVLVMLATALLVAVFHPAIAAGTPGPDQAAAIALIVLLLARLALAMRHKSKKTEH